MSAIHPCELPANALLRKYAGEGYADCYVTTVGARVQHAEFVAAFYTTTLFKMERAILRLVGLASTDQQARELATGARDTFAAWRVEARDVDQLLLSDIRGRTKSWLMLTRTPDDAAVPQTQLYFGSAVVPHKNPRSGQKEMGLVFRALLGLHKLYSRALLGSARRRLMAGRRDSD